MSSRLNPYLGFAGTARQAMEFYRDVFGGELTLSTYGESGMDAPATRTRSCTPSSRRRPATRSWPPTRRPGMETSGGSDISVSLSGDDAEDLRGYFAKLSEGGTVTMPLEKQMWGDEFGMCVDRFGIDWMVNISQPGG